MRATKQPERYVQARPRKDGSTLYIWNRKGFRSRSLGEDASLAMAVAHRLNEDADRGIRPRNEVRSGHETLASYCDRYEQSDKFKSLAPASRRNYRLCMRRLCATYPHDHIAEFKRIDLKYFLETVKAPTMRLIYRALLQNIFSLAENDEVIESNPAYGIALPSPRPRRQLWDDATFERFMTACDILDKTKSGAEAMRRAMLLMAHTAQRPGDILALGWNHPANFIRIEQQKTGRLVEIYCGELGPLIDKWRAELPVHPTSVDAPYGRIVHYPDGQPFNMQQFAYYWRKVARMAKIGDLQKRDLRRTAVTRAFEAGCSEGEIAAVTGHDIEQTRRILETYFVRTRTVSQRAITKLDAYRAERRLAIQE